MITLSVTLFEARFPISSSSCCNCHHVVPDELNCLRSVVAQSDRLFQEGRIPITRETRDTVFSDIPGLPPTRALDLSSPFVNPPIFEYMRKYVSWFRRAEVILVNTFYDIEKPVLDALLNQVIGSPDMKVSAHFSGVINYRS